MGGDVEGLVDHLGQLVGLAHQPVMLGAGPGDAHRVGLLEAIGADHEGGHLASEDHQRDGIEERVGQAGNRIGRRRARGHQRHARLAGRAGIALGGMDRALFVAHQDVADIVLLEDLVIDRKHGAAGISEYRVHTLILQGLNHHFRSGHLTCHASLRSTRHQKKAPGPAGAHGVMNGSVTGPCATFPQLPECVSFRGTPSFVRATLWGRAGGVNRELAE